MSLHIVNELGDLNVEIVENDETTRDANGNQVVKEVARFQVSRDVLIKSSQPLLKMLLDRHWMEASQSIVSLGEGHVTATDIWLRVMHNTKLSYTAPFTEMWHLVAAIDYYELDVTKFNAWFAAWYEANTPLMLKPRELLYPTWRFDHAKAFARWTHYLAYEHVGHITEANPTKLYDYHLPSRIIRKLECSFNFLHSHLTAKK